MEKFSKQVVAVNQVGEPDQHGNHAYSIVFADNSSGFFKCKEQDLFTPGEVAEFYIEKATGKSGKEYNKIRRVSSVEFDQPGKPLTAGTSESGSGKSKDDKFDHDGMMRSVAIKAICELRSNTKTNTETILKEAEVIFDYLKFGVSNGEPKDGHKEALQITPAQTIELDDLPF